ncbi:MAG: protein kinase, partial [Eubacterium sp.]|nr:protein kinase [Eubacterium sp.]
MGKNLDIFIVKYSRKFLREAKFLCRFHSLESVISILNLFYANQTAYIVMEYIQGETLQEYVDRKGAIPAKETLALM